MKFSQLELSNEMQRALTKMHFSDAMPVQAQTIAPMMEKHDVLVQSPTGSGKTCAFCIPLVESIDTHTRTIQAVVLCPTRELALQTTAVLHSLSVYKQGVKAVAVYGGESIGKQMAAIRQKPQIIVATPGRFIDLMHRRIIKLGAIKLVVMDEADRMLDMGFREDMDTILSCVPGTRQTVLFSATLSRPILEIAQSYQTDAKTVTIAQDTRTADSVEQYYLEVAANGKQQALEALLRTRSEEQSLVFVATKVMADSLAEALSNAGFLPEALHGGLQQRQRDKVMNRFRSGKTRILVATDVAARGIDIRNMGTVINYDIPQNSDDYVHRIGRTGRANASGVAYTFLYPRERGHLRTIVRETKANIQPATIEGYVPTIQKHDKPQSAQKRSYAAGAKRVDRNGNRFEKQPWRSKKSRYSNSRAKAAH